MKKQAKIDHIVYVTKTLEQTVKALEDRLQVKLEVGGKHPAFGTKNYLLSLGDDCYLEVIGPDPDRTPGLEPAIFGIDLATKSRIGTFAIKSKAIASDVEKAALDNLQLGPIFPGERQKPDGSTLKWQLSNPMLMSESGLIPFIIDWGAGPHPCDTLPAVGYSIETVKLFHPKPAHLKAELAKINIDFEIEAWDQKEIEIMLNGPNGLIKL